MTEFSATTVLVISRQLVSGGETIGQRVATLLQMRFANSEIPQQAALALKVSHAD